MKLPPVTVLQQALLSWYDANAHDLPWRRTKDPYCIWVSEIMLQQTQVETVLPFYQRFMEALPNIWALAGASEDEVLKLWEGLGYYTRARNLREAAKIIVNDMGGTFPSTAEGLRMLPGIGRYTAGAIASIAYDIPAAAVDGNIKRIYARLLAERRPLEDPHANERLWEMAERTLPEDRPGDFNQALMDLGAAICRPRKPACEKCPLEPHCAARAAGLEAKLPKREAKRPVPHYEIVAALIERRGRYLIGRRPPGGLLGGLWELPGGKVKPGEVFERALHREIREEVGLSVAVKKRVALVYHAYSHFTIDMHVYSCAVLHGRTRAKIHTELKWIKPEEFDEYAFPAANRKIFAIVRLTDPKN